MNLIKALGTTLGVTLAILLGLTVLLFGTLLQLLVWVGVILIATWLMTFIGIPTNIGLWISGLTLFGIKITTLIKSKLKNQN
ncbi:hypothetical protein [Lactobacillus sp. ESL0225]|uniref:hypothetical protein n=1 Tax=Lactobacillus sp. ESL0225 TaxID=2069351 RepID=UPI000EFB13A1|nr:hypothetical protein [Lactobacillus sp. ESL0225]RMC47723.1 hypothetical protein F5ESL0225_08160 [Lactobacillus sp. ESL0225]